MDANLPLPVTLFVGVAANPRHPPSAAELLGVSDGAASEPGGSLSEHLRRYELIAAVRSEIPSPTLLTAVDLPNESAAQRCFDRIGRALGSVSDEEGNELEAKWSAAYRHVADTGAPTATPYAIYLVGVDPPRGLNEDEIEEFNEFYTNIHVPEVVARRRCLRATRFELLRELSETRCPRYLALYEVDAQAAQHRRHIGGAYSSGPDVWRRHRTPWRLWYRLLA